MGIVLVSGQVTPTMVDCAIGLGVVDVIDKDDFTPPLLSRVVRYAATLRKAQVSVEEVV